MLYYSSPRIFLRSTTKEGARLRLAKTPLLLSCLDMISIVALAFIESLCIEMDDTYTPMLVSKN